MDCLFCKIASGEIPCAKIYEDEDVLSFLDIKPVNIGHSLVISKDHHENIHETPEELAAKLMKVVKKVAEAVKNGVTADGINIVMNNGVAASQVIFHTHIHVIPRFLGDGFPVWHGKRDYRAGEKDEVSNRIAHLLL